LAFAQCTHAIGIRSVGESIMNYRCRVLWIVLVQDEAAKADPFEISSSGSWHVLECE
jgi:hypothetical protein